ncbi:MAG: hypothetical protein ACRD3W_18435, partial [Terriglobales bacterium]
KLADAQFRSGNFVDAVPSYRRLQSLGIELLGPQHPQVQEVAERLRLASDRLASAVDAHAQQRSAPQHPAYDGNGEADSDYDDIDAEIRSPRAIDPRRLVSNMVDPNLAADEIDLSDDPSQKTSWRKKKAEGGRAKVANMRRAERAIKEARPADFKRSRPGVRTGDDKIQDAAIRMIMLHGTALASVGALIVIVVCGVFVFSNISTQDRNLSRISKATRPVKFHATSYATADGVKQIELSTATDAKLVYPKSARSIKLPYVKIGPEWRDFLWSSLECLSKKDVWLEETAQGLRDQDGVVYYAKDVPEFQVISRMQQFGNNVNIMWRAGNKYPEDPQYFRNFLYSNPFTGDMSFPLLTFPSALQSDDGRIMLKDSGNADPDLAKSLRQLPNAYWNGESAPTPGAIHVMTIERIYTQPYTYDFYMHGFDRSGQLITGSAPGSVYLIAFKNGVSQPPPIDVSIPSVKQRSLRLCLIKVPPNFNVGLRLLHFIFPMALFVGSCIIFLASQATRTNKTEVGNFADIAAFLCFIISIVWGLLLGVL